MDKTRNSNVTLQRLVLGFQSSGDPIEKLANPPRAVPLPDLKFR